LLRSWIVEGSEDGSGWTTLDEREGNTELDSDLSTVAFSVKHRMHCRFIRLRQTRKCANNTDTLTLYAFELFGLLIE
jgi:hypothetical protein